MNRGGYIMACKIYQCLLIPALLLVTLAAGGCLDKGTDLNPVQPEDVTYSNGILDDTFNAAGAIPGIFTLSSLTSEFFGIQYQSYPGRDLLIQEDGKILTAGYTTYVSNNVTYYGLFLARFDEDGSPDTTFGDDGVVTRDFGSNCIIRGVDIFYRKIIAVGQIYDTGGAYHFALLRFNADGSSDTTFGEGGMITTPIDNNDVALAVAIQADGKIVAAGTVSTETKTSGVVVRYKADGSLDSSFGEGGKVITPVGSSADQFYTVGIQSDGKIVAAGRSGVGDHWPETFQFLLVRYNRDGSLDTTFGEDGIVTTLKEESDDNNRHDDRVYEIAFQTDGKIVIAGGFRVNEALGAVREINLGLARYHTNGILDTTFGGTGIIKESILTHDDRADDWYALAIQADGKIVAGTSHITESHPNNYYVDFALVRYKSDGSRDEDFGDNGRVIQNLGIGDFVHALAIQADGKIVVVGESGADESWDHGKLTLLRFGN